MDPHTWNVIARLTGHEWDLNRVIKEIEAQKNVLRKKPLYQMKDARALAALDREKESAMFWWGHVRANTISKKDALTLFEFVKKRFESRTQELKQQGFLSIARARAKNLFEHEVRTLPQQQLKDHWSRLAHEARVWQACRANFLFARGPFASRLELLATHYGQLWNEWNRFLQQSESEKRAELQRIEAKNHRPRPVARKQKRAPWRIKRARR